MSDFSASWNLSRGRFVDAVSGLNQSQLNWRIHPGSLTIGEMALHVAGVEVSFASQLLNRSLGEFEGKLKSAATDGVVNDKPFPFDSSEIVPETVAKALDTSKTMVESMISSPSEAVLMKEIVSALGPVITGKGALARLAFHPAYHQGQVHTISTAPGFPG